MRSLDPHIRARLEALRREGEVISPIQPEALCGGRWWGGAPWPPALRSGVLEPRRGYQFRPENLALAAALPWAGPAERVVELGAGSGSLLLMTQALLPGVARLAAVEQQPEVAERLVRTLSAHALSEAAVVVGDLRSPQVQAQALAALEGPADLVVMNPPWFEEGWGRPSERRTTHLSTHAIKGDAGDFLAAARALLQPRGRALVVYDAARLADLLAFAGAWGFGLLRLDWIPGGRGGAGGAPFRVWVTLALEGGATLAKLGA